MPRSRVPWPSEAKKCARPVPLFLSILFPIIALLGDDQGIGQTLQDLMPLADYVSLMIYPSHFEEGISR